jgi:hypothetical protein
MRFRCLGEMAFGHKAGDDPLLEASEFAAQQMRGGKALDEALRHHQIIEPQPAP